MPRSAPRSSTRSSASGSTASPSRARSTSSSPTTTRSRARASACRCTNAPLGYLTELGVIGFGLWAAIIFMAIGPPVTRRPVSSEALHWRSGLAAVTAVWFTVAMFVPAGTGVPAPRALRVRGRCRGRAHRRAAATVGARAREHAAGHRQRLRLPALEACGAPLRGTRQAAQGHRQCQHGLGG